MAQVADPLGGSYFVEALTDQMEEAAMAYIEKIDELGGIVRAVEEGYPQREIANAAYQFQRQVDTRQRAIVGVNKYVDKGEGDKIPLLKIDYEVERSQVERMKKLKASRDRRRGRQGARRRQARRRGRRQPRRGGARGREQERDHRRGQRRVPPGLGRAPRSRLSLTSTVSVDERICYRRGNARVA